ncbi:MAG: SH3 domain-containing protein [Rectinemataceae bacterium]|nr:SH3 domain-containing protein [Rectinemataceae bacterium]
MRKTGVFLTMLLSALVGLASSCTPRLGWGVVVWSVPGASGAGNTASRGSGSIDSIPTGSIVPVYIKSNIGKVYIIGIPGSPRTKLEVEQWRVEVFGSRGKAARRIKDFGEYLDTFMISARDGVPLREKPTNAGKRVFKLRVGQTVKVFAKVEGESVTTGGKPLPGDWYLVMADDGTKGYVFSYAMKLYRESESGALAAKGTDDFPDRIDAFFANAWRPDWFRTMIDSGSLDLDRFALKYGLFADAVRKQIRIELPGVSETFNYTSISESSGTAVFEGTSLSVSFPSGDRILARWPDSQEFILIPEDIRAEIRKEGLARQDRLSSFVSAEASAMHLSATSSQVTMESPESGRFVLSSSGRFTWTGRENVPEGFVPAGAGESGSVVMRLVMDEVLKADWNGAVSLDFAGSDLPPVDFLYRTGPDGVVFARAVTEPGTNHVIEVDRTTGNVTFPANN